MHKIDCPKFEDGCSAPLCPLGRNSMKDGIWYSDEEICKVKDFRNLGWIKKQKQIAKAKALKDKYFTAAMLQAIKQVRKGIEGINPDQPIDKAKEAERKWIVEKNGSRVIAKQNQKNLQVVAKKRAGLAFVTNTSHQEKEVKNEV